MTPEVALSSYKEAVEMSSERRRARRYQFIADAEVTEIPSEAMLRAKTSDLSAGGCFLDMMNPSPEGSEIRVRIFYADTTFTAFGTVVFVLPNMGMGIVFTSVAADQSAVLQKWISELSREG